MRHHALIVLEALLLGQRVVMPTGHTLMMEDEKLYIMGEQDSGDGTQDVLLDPGALGELDLFAQQCKAMPLSEVFLIGAQSTMKKMANERVQARQLAFEERSRCQDCGGTGMGSGPARRGGPPVCKPCDGTGVVR